MSAATEENQLITPGTIIGYTDTYQLGTGTYTRNNDGRIYAAIVGRTFTKRDESQPTHKPFLHVLPPGHQLPNDSTTESEAAASSSSVVVVVPEISDLATCRVLKITPQLAKVDILVVGDRALDTHTTFSGIIRQQDIRATEIDKVQVQQSFRPGDIVKARVISLGDSRSYYLSTASNDLGVIYATSAVGQAPMIPVNWNEMQCTKTGMRELRKVAKTI